MDLNIHFLRDPKQHQKFEFNLEIYKALFVAAVCGTVSALICWLIEETLELTYLCDYDEDKDRCDRKKFLGFTVGSVGKGSLERHSHSSNPSVQALNVTIAGAMTCIEIMIIYIYSIHAVSIIGVCVHELPSVRLALVSTCACILNHVCTSSRHFCYHSKTLLCCRRRQ